MYTYCSSKKKQTTDHFIVLLFIISLIISVHVESPNYKMICLESPKSSELLFFNKQWSKILNYVDFFMFKQLFNI